MTEQDKNYVIEALEYALHKCIDVNGDSETHYNTLANAIDVVKNCSIPAVVGRSEQLVCETCIFNTHSWSEDYPCATCCGFDKHQAT